MFKCERRTDPASGFRRIELRNGGGLFAVDDGREGSSAIRARGDSQRSHDWRALALRFHTAILPAQLRDLAATLGVRADPLVQLGTGWATKPELRELAAGGRGWSEDYPDGAFTFPEYDGAGVVVGLSFRDRDGRKGGPSGGGRGLIVPTNLSSLAGPVLVVEGASDVAALLSLGIAAVGRPSNATGAVELAAQLHGRDVRIVGENDRKPDGAWPGLDGAVTVAEDLADAWRKPVAYVMPPESVKDVREWLRAQVAIGLDLNDDDARLAAGRSLIAELDAARVVVEPARVKRPLRFQPFPNDALPPLCRRFVESVAMSIGVQTAAVALPFLIVLAAAVGNTRRARIKKGHDEPPLLWGLLLGRAGLGKTPIFGAVMAPLVDIESELFRTYEFEMKQWKKRGGDDDDEGSADDDSDGSDGVQSPPKPRPVMRRLIVKDATIEALHQLLSNNPDGLLLHIDEFAGFVGAFDAYRPRSASDRSRWIELYDASPLCVDRKKSKDVLRIPSAAVCVLSGAQPGILRKVIGDAEHQSGFFGRFAVTLPPGEADPLSTAEVDPQLVSEISMLYRRLIANRSGPFGMQGGVYRIVRLTDDARAEYHAYIRSNLEDDRDAPPDLEASLIKLRPWAVRLALVLHAVRQAIGDSAVDPDWIDAATMRDATRIAGFCRHEAKRVHALLSGSHGDSQVAADVDWIRRRGGSVTLRDFQRTRTAGTRDDALARLEAIERARLGAWDPEPKVRKPGRHSRTLRLVDESTDSTIPQVSPPTEISQAAARRIVETSSSDSLPGANDASKAIEPPASAERDEADGHVGSHAREVDA
ncbi:MAG: DUF3987 domain-containing protein [Planctomycetes bacterium]|nr:DUF3987 domain-containing protein [Planctomycetota bacterium]